MKKNTIKINESQLRQIVAESVKRILREGDYDDIDFSKTRGVKLPTDNEDGWYYSPVEIKTAILNLQNSLKKVMDMCNGNRMGDDLSNEIWDACHSFNNFITQYRIELDDECRDYEGTWQEKHANIPFIRKYDDNFGTERYFDKSGKPIDDRERFGGGFTPHKKK